MIHTTCYTGSTRGIRTYFTDAVDDPVNPDTVTAWVIEPDGTVTTLTPSVDTDQHDDDVSGAVYYKASAAIDAKGLWRFFMKGVTGTVEDVAMVELHALESSEP